MSDVTPRFEDGSQWPPPDELGLRPSSRSSFTDEWVEVSDFILHSFIEDKTYGKPERASHVGQARQSAFACDIIDTACSKEHLDQVVMNTPNMEPHPYQAHNQNFGAEPPTPQNFERASHHGLSHFRYEPFGLVQRDDECELSTAASPLSFPCEHLTERQQNINLARARVKRTWDEHLRAKQELAFLEKTSGLNNGQQAIDCICPQCASRSSLRSDIVPGKAARTIPTGVEKYLDFTREAFVQHERLTELDADFDENTIARIRNGTLSADSQPLHDGFEEAYKHERREIIEALTIAHYRLQAQRNECLSQGIDPEHFRYQSV